MRYFCRLKSKRGSTLVWTLIVVLVISIVLAGGLAMSGSYFTRSTLAHSESQAYYTAYSVSRAVASWLVGDADKSLIAADRDKFLDTLKTDPQAFSLTEEELGGVMGSCDVVVNYTNESKETIDVKADAVYGGESYSIVATVKAPVIKNELVSGPAEVAFSGEDKEEETWIVPASGLYKLEVWGAAGGGQGEINSATGGSAGGYSVGQVYLTQGTTVYCKAGGKGLAGVAGGGFNGGGNPTESSYFGGGGASDIRIETDNLYARVIAAGGGGGARDGYGLPGGGGGEEGLDSSVSNLFSWKGTQTEGGLSACSVSGVTPTKTVQYAKYVTNGSFGLGGSWISTSGTLSGFGGGGGGWYGGGAGHGGAGGSGWIYTQAAYDTWSAAVGPAVSGNWLLSSDLYLSNAFMKESGESMPDPLDPESEIAGNSGYGYVKISRLFSDEGADMDADVPEGTGIWANAGTEAPAVPDVFNLDGDILNADTYVIPVTGRYQLEVWGAQGGGGGYYSYTGTEAAGGKGGYSAGIVTLEQGTVLHLKAGGQGTGNTPGFYVNTSSIQRAGGLNGGGGGNMYGMTGGGGAADIRIGTDSLYARVIVGGGGGGGGNSGSATQLSNGGPGGGAIAPTVLPAAQFSGRIGGQGGTQTSGYQFGIGETSTNNNLRGGGGGGWYGGTVGDNSTGGGGGSGWVYTASAYSAWAAAVGSAVSGGWLLNSGYYLSDAETRTGDQAMPNPRGEGEITGNAGNGYIRITNLTPPAPPEYILNNGDAGAVDTFTVPGTGDYKLETWGAQGGNVGTALIGFQGAYAVSYVHLEKNQVLKVLAGGKGGYGAGGGGSFITTESNDPLCIAGGGGGQGGPSLSGSAIKIPGDANYGQAQNDGGTTSTGNSGGGKNGSGGNNGVTNGEASGGGGLLTDGIVSSTPSTYGYPGKAFVNGAQGGAGTGITMTAGGTFPPGSGGLGGGGGAGNNNASGYFRGGGGGGYSGGQGGTYSPTTVQNAGGAGGGSYFTGAGGVAISGNQSMPDPQNPEATIMGNSGGGTVKISMPGGALLGGYTVTAYSPTYSSPAGGGTITFTGEGFGYYADKTNEMIIGGAACTDVTVVSDTTITAKAPDHAIGLVDIDISLGGDTVLIENGFRYLTGAEITPGTTTVVYDEGYKGAADVFTVEKTGEYRLEVWGAQGGDNAERASFLGGRGGYSVGTVHLTAGTKLYIRSGGKGRDAGKSSDTTLANSFNGGGVSTTNYSYSTYPGRSADGGGASDIRVGTDSLYARVIVAGGGGGAGIYDWVAHGSTSYTQYQPIGGGGGGTSGLNGSDNSNTIGYGGLIGGASALAQAAYAGSFGQGGAYSVTGYANGAGGGGGWFGGSSSGPGSSAHTSGGGGGSGWVFTEQNAGYTASSYTGGAWLLGPEYYLRDADTIAGDQSIPSPDLLNETLGRSGDGHVKITLLGADAPTVTNPVTIINKTITFKKG